MCIDFWRKLQILSILCTAVITLSDCGAYNSSARTTEKGTLDEQVSEVKKELEEKPEEMYELLSETEVNFDEGVKKLSIYQDNKSEDGRIHIFLDQEEFSVSQPVADGEYLHPEVELLDIDGDGRKEIALILVSDGTGANRNVQIFKEDNGWKNIEIPEVFYNEWDVQMKSEKELELKSMGDNDIHERIPVKEKAEIFFTGRKYAVVKEDYMEYLFDIDADVHGNTIATVRFRLKYDGERYILADSFVKYHS